VVRSNPIYHGYLHLLSDLFRSGGTPLLPLLLLFLIFFLILDHLEFLDTHALGDLLQLDLWVLGLDLSCKELLKFLELVQVLELQEGDVSSSFFADALNGQGVFGRCGLFEELDQVLLHHVS